MNSKGKLGGKAAISTNIQYRNSDKKQFKEKFYT